ncbi:MAG: hypothetical protein Q4F79_07470 [Eubacteriales bacterium]|nr:hypothetical protein [Eubacteriales bacterium]
MVTIRQITAAVNQRCKMAMALAGYQNPQCSSLNREEPPRPGCITNISSGATVQAGGMAVRTINVLIMFFPEDEESPYDELKNMDDCLTRAFLNPIFVDGYRVLPNDEGITVRVDVDHDILDVVVSYEFDLAEEEILLELVDEENIMETLQDAYCEGE